jgi:hypothetical protein
MQTAIRPTEHVLEFYAQPGKYTSAGRHEPRFAELPRQIADLAVVAQGLVLHEHWAPAYGVTLSDERRSGVHVRPVAQILDRLIAEDGRSLTEARPAEARHAGNCRHFSVLLVAMLRARGVPARARCGFGAYFGTGAFEDHWVGEYWNEAEGRWRLVDAQIDELQRTALRPDFDLLDVPRDRFIVAGDAWATCRAGEADPERFGLSGLNEGGLWWIAGNLLRDVAALNNLEMLPWDCWGAMPEPNQPTNDDDLALFDQLASLTQAPDAWFSELRGLYETDARLRVPATVFNAVLNRMDEIDL